MTGRLIAVVGPSGAGKDTLMAAIGRARPDLHIVRRVVTRPSEAGGEPFEGVTEAEFRQRQTRGDFLFAWAAHGLSYGIPASVREVPSRAPASCPKALSTPMTVPRSPTKGALPATVPRIDR